jgi:hypothetical protein
MIGHAQVFGPEFGRNLDRHPGGERVVDHGIVDAFGVQIDFDRATAFAHAVENRFPKIIAAFGHAAFPVSAQRDAADGRARLQQRANGIAAIRGVILFG